MLSGCMAMRNFGRRLFFGFLEKVASTHDARVIWSRTLKGQLGWRPAVPFRNCDAHPYPDIGPVSSNGRPRCEDAPIFITGRFRSGSTLLWNLFRNIEGMTAYYEPFNERRWYDATARGDWVDPSHKNTGDYWNEYVGCDSLKELYREEWTSRNLYMDAGFWDPIMKRYVECLIERAPGRAVLQFNRIDFRLPWFRANFPDAKIVHLYRHPRDQWCSTLIDPQCFPQNGTMREFVSRDKFYLRTWARDLEFHFPFLAEEFVSHPYQMFYYIWKLSYLFGSHYADLSMAFEDLTDNAAKQLQALFGGLGIREYDMSKLQGLIHPPEPKRWVEYADDAWFRSHEAACEKVISDFLNTRPAGTPFGD